MIKENKEQVKMWICNDCGNELVNSYCTECKSTNTEELSND